MGFPITAWGYTFPAAALAGALVHYDATVRGPISAVLAELGLPAATAVVAIVAARSLPTLLKVDRTSQG
jgi:tellurite resistance protein TehA-like permease